MGSMHAAVVHQFDQPPRYEAVPEPVAEGEEAAVVDVLAAGLHPRVRSQADGSHYTSTAQLPLVPGIDGVGRLADGSVRYFVLPDTERGSMADRTVVDLRRSIPVPADADPVALAAAMNPAMSSWVALQRRAAFEPGQSVLVLGATGSAGRLAIQVAEHLGASRVVAAGRDAARLASLPDLGADATVDLAAEPGAIAEDLAASAAEVDVVLDYLWGPPAEAAMSALVRGRSDRSRRLCWVQIGAVAGADLRLPSAVLRQSAIEVLGSGQGSVTAAGMLATLPELAELVTGGAFSLGAVARPLAEVEQAWPAPAGRGTERIVFVP